MTFWRFLMVLAFLILAGVVAVFAVLQPKPVNEFGCRRDGVVAQHTVVLIDQSDPFAEQDVRWAQKVISDESRRLGKYGRLTLVGLRSETPYEPEEVFSRCSPGVRSNGWTDNPRMIEDTFLEAFSDPLAFETETLLAQIEQPSSPLVEALIGIADRSDFSSSIRDRRVVLVSDLIQNSPELSHLRTGAVDFSSVEDSRFDTEKPKLDGVQVVVRVVPRRTYRFPKEDLVDFWVQMFEASGAESPEII